MKPSIDRPDPSFRRLRLEEVDVERSASADLDVTVTLSDDESLYRGGASGVGSETVELRLVAEATVDAISSALGRTSFVRLLGVKRIRAFDEDLVLAALRPEDSPTGQLVGGVPIRDDPRRATAAAVMDAVNRLLDPQLG